MDTFNVPSVVDVVVWVIVVVVVVWVVGSAVAVSYTHLTLPTILLV